MPSFERSGGLSYSCWALNDVLSIPGALEYRG